MIGRLAGHPAIGQNAPAQPAAMNARAVTIVDVTNVHRVVAAPVIGPHSGTTVVAMIVRRAAGLLAGMMTAPPTATAVRVMNDRTTQASQGALRKEVTIVSARRSGQDQAKAPDQPLRVVVIATNVHSVCAPDRTVTIPATDQAKEAADRLHASKNSFPDRSG